ncbi:hypothetical protein GGTG_07759 [Gaeumannomyces tritici R3-111a-1]|uniref:Uncharacterized protein n=1 Tax=Gaeumannomyces tritici (strain R3-111a-1) TaxID=644352 RepID=J3P2L3_GAET3|nr:hypothetical protein GGTG_07759 [Gaeumannomyces tritici R3-111a-1]EJT73905.1 hypothetical protein GGTG_07759 [Gaeumannomyces tritici R3-111a-1]
MSEGVNDGLTWGKKEWATSREEISERRDEVDDWNRTKWRREETGGWGQLGGRPTLWVERGPGCADVVANLDGVSTVQFPSAHLIGLSAPEEPVRAALCALHPVQTAAPSTPRHTTPQAPEARYRLGAISDPDVPSTGDWAARPGPSVERDGVGSGQLQPTEQRARTFRQTPSSMCCGMVWVSSLFWTTAPQGRPRWYLQAHKDMAEPQVADRMV